MGSPWETDVGGSEGAEGGGRGESPVADEGADEGRLLMSPGAYAAAAVALLLIGLLGFVTNLLVMVLMCKNKQLWTPLNAILFNLVCSDFSVSLLGNPMTLTAALYRRWIFGRTMCVIYGFFMSLLGIASITTLMVLSFERYVMISKPFQVRRLSHKGAMALIGAIWMYSLVLTTPPLFGWGDYVNESANISCSVNWESKTISATTYIIFLFAMGLVVPVSVICFSYFNIIWTMKKNMITMGRVNKAESRVALMVFVMIVAFLVAWTPYSVLALLVAFGDPSFISPGVAVVPALMAKSSICYNPVIYVGLNTQFRSAWHKLLRVRAISETSPEAGVEHTAMLSPSHCLSHTLLEGATSASSILICGVCGSPSRGNIGATALLKRKGGVNGESSRPLSLAATAGPRSSRAFAVVDALPEEEGRDEAAGNDEEVAGASSVTGDGRPVPKFVGGVGRVGGRGKRVGAGGLLKGKKRKGVSDWSSAVDGGLRGVRRSPGEGIKGRRGRRNYAGGGWGAAGKSGDGGAAQESKGGRGEEEEGDVEMRMLSATVSERRRSVEDGDVASV